MGTLGVSKQTDSSEFSDSTVVLALRASVSIQWNLSIKGTLDKRNLSNEDTACSPNHIELCTNLPLKWRYLSIQDSQVGPSSVEEVPLYVRK